MSWKKHQHNPTQPTKWIKNVKKIRYYRLGIVIVFWMRVCANGV
jgi:hypothetical protein